MNDALDKILCKDNARPLAMALVQFQHVGTVVYYPVPTTTAVNSPCTCSPVAMRDCQFLPESVPEFCGNKLVRVPAVKRPEAGTPRWPFPNSSSRSTRSCWNRSRTTSQAPPAHSKREFTQPCKAISQAHTYRGAAGGSRQQKEQ
jgi:hypothetical protein